MKFITNLKKEAEQNYENLKNSLNKFVLYDKDKTQSIDN